MREWLKNAAGGLCLLLTLSVIATIIYFVFAKPIEDRVNAEWQEKYDEMVSSYEEYIEQIFSDYDEATDMLMRDAYDEGYKAGYDVGYDDGVLYYDGSRE